MATRIHVRHECDRCDAVSESDLPKIGTDVPAGWHLFTVAGVPHLWCPDCVALLDRFRVDYENAEQSR